MEVSDSQLQVLQILCLTPPVYCGAGLDIPGRWLRGLDSLPQSEAAEEKPRVCANAPARGVVYNGAKLPDLLIEAEYRSRQTRSPTDITLVTQLSADR